MSRGVDGSPTRRVGELAPGQEHGVRKRVPRGWWADCCTGPRLGQPHQQSQEAGWRLRRAPRFCDFSTFQIREGAMLLRGRSYDQFWRSCLHQGNGEGFEQSVPAPEAQPAKRQGCGGNGADMREEIQSWESDGGGDHLLGRRRHPPHQPHIREDGAPPTGGHCPTGGNRAGRVWPRWCRRRQRRALIANASPCQKTTIATLSDPGTGRNRGGISPCMVPASVSTVAPITPTWVPAAKAAWLASSEGEAAAAITASRPAAAEGPTTGAGCPATNAATNPVGSGSYGSEFRTEWKFWTLDLYLEFHQFYQPFSCALV